MEAETRKKKYSLQPKMSFRGRGRGTGFGLSLETNSIVTYKEAELYPHLTLPAFKGFSEEEDLLFKTHSSLLEDFQKSPFNLDVPIEQQVAIKRYTDQYIVADEKQSLPTFIKIESLDVTNIPQEINLLNNAFIQKKSTKEFAINLDLLEKMGEGKNTKRTDAVDGVIDEEDENDLDVEGGEDSEADNDYAVDHYDEDMDAVGVSDNDD